MISSQSTVIELSRSQLLQWINSLLLTNIIKIQQLGTGSIYCQLLDYLFPKILPLNKVNFKAKSEYEYINNFKILQQSFTKLNIMKYVEVQKLIKCKYQDNLQFLQWFKRLFDQSGKNIINNSFSDIELHLPLGNIENFKQSKRSVMSSSRINSNNLPNKIPKYTPLNSLRDVQAKLSAGHLSNSNLTKSTKQIPDGRKHSNPQTLKSTPKSKLKQSFIDQSHQKDEVTEITSFFSNQRISYAEYEAEKQFFLNKFDKIQHLLEYWKMKRPSGQLVQQIRKILYYIPEQSSLNHNDWGINEQQGQVYFSENIKLDLTDIKLAKLSFHELSEDKKQFFQMNDNK